MPRGRQLASRKKQTPCGETGPAYVDAVHGSARHPFPLDARIRRVAEGLEEKKNRPLRRTEPRDNPHAPRRPSARDGHGDGHRVAQPRRVRQAVEALERPAFFHARARREREVADRVDVVPALGVGAPADGSRAAPRSRSRRIRAAPRRRDLHGISAWRHPAARRRDPVSTRNVPRGTPQRPPAPPRRRPARAAGTGARDETPPPKGTRFFPTPRRARTLPSEKRRRGRRRRRRRRRRRSRRPRRSRRRSARASRAPRTRPRAATTQTAPRQRRRARRARPSTYATNTRCLRVIPAPERGRRCPPVQRCTRRPDLGAARIGRRRRDARQPFLSSSQPEERDATFFETTETAFLDSRPRPWTSATSASAVRQKKAPSPRNPPRSQRRPSAWRLVAFLAAAKTRASQRSRHASESSARRAMLSTAPAPKTSFNNGSTSFRRRPRVDHAGVESRKYLETRGGPFRRRDPVRVRHLC